jgi:hypothetical protein
MSTVGTVVRDPGILAIPCAVTILRGQLVSFTPGTAGNDGTAKVPAAAGDRIYGIALSDNDTDLGLVWIATGGPYTVAMQPSTGSTFQHGQLVYQDQTAFNKITGTVTASKIIGWAVSQKADSQGNYEVAFFFNLAT